MAKSPGVSVLPSPVLGGAPTLRIRGISSISLSNAPIWVVDGVRYNTNNPSTSSGQTPVSLLNSLSPEEIEDIEIVKGSVGRHALWYQRGERRGDHHDEKGPGWRHALELDRRIANDRRSHPVPGAVRQLRTYARPTRERTSAANCR